MNAQNFRMVLWICLITIVFCAVRIIVAVFGALYRYVRHGDDHVRHAQSWTGRLISYLLLIIPLMTIGSFGQQRLALAQDIGQNLDDEESCAVPLAASENHLGRNAFLVSLAVGVGILFRLRSKRQVAACQDLEVPPLSLEVEAQINRSGEELSLVRLDLAVRSLFVHGHQGLRMLVHGVDGLIRAEFTHELAAIAPWTQCSGRVIELSTETSLETLALFTSGSPSPTPLLIPVGQTLAGDVWINLDEVKTFGISCQGPQGDAVWRGICQSLSLSPFAYDISILSDEVQQLPARRLIVERQTEKVGALAHSLHAFESPSVLLLEGDQRFDQLTVYRGEIAEGAYGLEFADHGWILQPQGVAITPIGCEVDEVELIKSLLGEGETVFPWPIERWRHEEARHQAIDALLPPFSFVAAVLGAPEVRHISGRRVLFEKAKSEELVLWLALHPTQRRRSLARSDMWNVPVKDATFSNITSDVRRSLIVAQLPPEGEQWLGVTMTDELALHVGIVSDVDILRACVEHARRWPEDGGIEVLRHGLGLVRGASFESCLYIWSDSTGLTTESAILVVRAAQMLAEMCAEVGDVDGVYWATAKGLLAVPGHEDLVATRLRLQSDRGDTAALHSEWQAYCRVVAHDPWGQGEPSVKMLLLWRELRKNESYPSSTAGSI